MKDSPLNILLVEDDPSTRARFTDIIFRTPELLLLAGCATGQEALNALRDGQPDILLVDLGLPDLSGLEVIRETVRRHPGCDIMVISVFGDEQHVMAAIEAGATGYLLKDSGAEDIIRHIRILRDGGSPISPIIARRLLSRFQPARAALPEAPATPSAKMLTDREAEVLRLVAVGYSNAEIAERLCLSPHTIATHIKHIYQKLAVRSRSAAIHQAGQRGLL